MTWTNVAGYWGVIFVILSPSVVELFQILNNLKMKKLLEEKSWNGDIFLCPGVCGRALQELSKQNTMK